VRRRKTGFRRLLHVEDKMKTSLSALAQLTCVLLPRAFHSAQIASRRD
jgi:hypothetical protein